MTISWSTPLNVTGAAVDIGTDDTYGLTLAAEGRSAPGVATVYHHARATGLDPGVEYRYRIRHDGGSPVVGRFRTGPAATPPFRFATFGDMGVTAAAAQIVQRLVAANPAFCFVVGDLCYADLSGGTSALAALPNDPTTWDRWLDQVGPSTSTAPWMTTVGNHEMERGAGDLGYDGYFARFALPGNGVPGAPVTYAFRYGNVGFVALDGNDASFEIDRNHRYLGDAQDRWLDATLASLRADPQVDFIVVGFHNCMYSSNAFHGSDAGNRSRWEPTFDRYGVDLVVNGHNHCYERTHPLRAGEPVADVRAGGIADAARGTTYLTAGGGGQAEYPTSTYPASYVVAERVPGAYGGVRVPEPALWSATRYLAQSIAVVDVTPPDSNGTARMTVRGVAKDGREVDRVTLQRRRLEPARRVA